MVAVERNPLVVYLGRSAVPLGTADCSCLAGHWRLLIRCPLSLGSVHSLLSKFVYRLTCRGLDNVMVPALWRRDSSSLHLVNCLVE